MFPHFALTGIHCALDVILKIGRQCSSLLAFCSVPFFAIDGLWAVKNWFRLFIGHSLHSSVSGNNRRSFFLVSQTRSTCHFSWWWWWRRKKAVRTNVKRLHSCLTLHSFSCLFVTMYEGEILRIIYQACCVGNVQPSASLRFFLFQRVVDQIYLDLLRVGCIFCSIFSYRSFSILGQVDEPRELVNSVLIEQS